MVAAASVLAVCTGNICRSPFTELLLARALPRAGHPVTVASRGTRAVVGAPMAEGMQAAAIAYDLDPTAHRAAQLERDDVAEAALVLTLALDHRRDAVALVPRASRRVFTLLEFARLLEDAAAAGTLPTPASSGPSSPVEPVETTPEPLLAAYVAAAAARRGFALAPDDEHADEVFDPYGRGQAEYELAASLIAAGVARIEAVLDGSYAVPIPARLSDPEAPTDV